MRSKELNSFFVEELMAVSFIKSNEDDSGGGGGGAVVYSPI